MTTTALDLPVVLPRGAECAECVEEFGDELRGLRGVRDVTADVPRGLLHVSFDNDLLAYDELTRDARRIGAAAHCAAHCPRDGHEHVRLRAGARPGGRRSLRAAPDARHRPRLRRLRPQARGRPATHRRRRERDHELRRGDTQGGVRPRRDRLRPGARTRPPARLRHTRGPAGARARSRARRPRARGRGRRAGRRAALAAALGARPADRRLGRGGGRRLCRRGSGARARAVPVRRGHGRRRFSHRPRGVVLAARPFGRHERPHDDRRGRRGGHRPVERGRPGRLSLRAGQPAADADHGTHAPRRPRPRRARAGRGSRRRRRPHPHRRRGCHPPRRPRAGATRRASAGRRQRRRRAGRGRPVAGHRRVHAGEQGARRRSVRGLDRPGRRPDGARHDDRLRQHHRQDHPPGRRGPGAARAAADHDRPLRRQIHAGGRRGGGRRGAAAAAAVRPALQHLVLPRPRPAHHLLPVRPGDLHAGQLSGRAGRRLPTRRADQGGRLSRTGRRPAGDGLRQDRHADHRRVARDRRRVARRRPGTSDCSPGRRRSSVRASTRSPGPSSPRRSASRTATGARTPTTTGPRTPTPRSPVFGRSPARAPGPTSTARPSWSESPSCSPQTVGCPPRRAATACSRPSCAGSSSRARRWS